MPLIKTPPWIEVQAPVIVPGIPFRAAVMLHCKVPVPVERVEVTLHGEINYDTHALSGNHSELSRARMILYARRVVLVPEAVELAGRTHYHTVDFQLPADVPGSYRGPRVSILWQLRVHVRIPWWFDARPSFALRVIQRSSSAARPAPPSLYTTNARGPAGRSPYAEVSLTSTVVRAGGTLRGYISHANTAHNNYWYTTIGLRQHLATRQSNVALSSSEPLVTIRVPPSPSDEQPVPFELPIPPHLVPGFTVRHLRMSWQVWITIRAASHFPRRIRLDIEVAPSDTPLPDPSDAPSLAMIGSERRAMAWSNAARDTGFSHEGGMLIQRADRYTVSIFRESKRRTGNHLVADTRMSEIDVGLHVSDGQLRCRDPEHSRRIAEATDALTDRHRLADADDRHLRYSVVDGGSRRQALVALARWTETLARALLDARDQLGAPASVAYLEPAFERAAGMLGGTFVPAGMDVWGRRDWLPFSLESRWDAEHRYCSTTLAVGTTIPIDSRYHGEFFAGHWPDPLPDGLEPLLAEAEALTIVPNGIEVHYPPIPDDGDPSSVEIEPLVERLEALIAIGRRLSLLDGVYR